MYINSGYHNHSLIDFKDKSRPLIVGSCGTYRLSSHPKLPTYRPKGRLDFQIIYIAAGRAHFHFDNADDDTVVTAGNIVLYRPKEFQKYEYYGIDKTEVYWVHFTGSETGKILDDYNIHIENNIQYVGTSPDYQWLFSQIIQELQLCRSKYEELISLLLKNIFILISRSIENNIKFSDTSEKEVAFAMHYFRKNYNIEISIDKYAESRGLSVCWFIRCFKQVTGSTPLQYILNLRISNAQSLLESTDYSIAEVASAVGYDNPLYFSRLFHKQVGMPPKEYRKKQNISDNNI